MVPLLLVANSPDGFEQYISALKTERNILPHLEYRLKPSKSELSIDEIKELKRELLTSAAGVRLIVLESFDTATLEAQNALLKTLEEKIEKADFVFCVSNPERIIPTIRSRTQTVYLDKHAAIEHKEANELMDRVISAKSHDFLASPLVSGRDKAEALMLLDGISMNLRARLFTDQGAQAARCLRMLLRVRSKVSDNNLNVQLALDYLLIFMHKTFTMK